jgi:hypothetical protein
MVAGVMVLSGTVMGLSIQLELGVVLGMKHGK